MAFAREPDIQSFPETLCRRFHAGPSVPFRSGQARRAVPGQGCGAALGFRGKRSVRRAAQKFAGLSRVYARGEVSLDAVRSVVASFAGCMAHCKGWRSAESAPRRLLLVRPPEPEEEDG